MSNYVVPANTSIKSFLPHLTIALIHHLIAGAIKIAQLAQTETQREREREREKERIRDGRGRKSQEKQNLAITDTASA